MPYCRQDLAWHFAGLLRPSCGHGPDMTDRSALLGRVQELLDRNDILECMHRYARGMDRQDRALLRSAYHDDAVDDHGGFVGPVEEFIDWAFAYHSSQTRYQHYLTNHLAEVIGDQAHAETYYLFIGTSCDPHAALTVAGGRYVDRLERRGGRWAIVARLCLIEWKSEMTSLTSPKFLASLARIQTVAHDLTDSSYIRPLNVRHPKPT